VSPKTPREGLQRDLSQRLMLPLLAIVAAAGIVGVFTAGRHVDRVYDRWLLDAALSLAVQVHTSPDGSPATIELAPSAVALLTFDEIDSIHFNATDGTRLIAGEPGLPDHGERETHYPRGRAFDAKLQGEDARIALVESCTNCARPVTIRVSETTHKRDRARLELLEMLLPLVALLGIAVVTIIVALRRTLGPLERIASRWNERPTASLQPVGTEGVPRELLPFATALNQLLERIRGMLARERQFALTAAHQLRTPLAGLQLGLARAAAAPDIGAARAVIAELQPSTQRTARLMTQLLALGRLDPELRDGLEFVPTDLAALAHEIGATYLDNAIGRGIALEFGEPTMPVRATVHADLVGEALANLLDNALRHTPRGGRVAIGFDSDPPAISVDDSGPGIDPGVREDVFERFVRGKDAGGEGSGLGLSIVRDIAVLHGGTVDIARSLLGGARVTLHFPKPAPSHAR
jgi:two-component system sensor histidine kinase TctE